MKDFWISSGHHLLDRGPAGHLVPTSEFLKLYLARPEVVPPPDACLAERVLHTSLLADPRRAVGPGEVAAIADPDARENWQVLVAFRDHLLAHPSLEAAYLALMRGGVGRTPALFINQLVHVIVRSMLDGEEDPHVLRAAELFFRPQRLTRHDGRLLLADEEVVDGAEAETHASPLIAMLGEAKVRQLDVLGDETADGYFARSDAFDMVLDFRPSGPGRRALATVMERWLGHMLGVTARITPLERIEDDAWEWFIGLDAEGTRIGNALWRGKPLSDADADRILALFALDLETPNRARQRPVYLILATDGRRIVRLKPQNLLVGLPETKGTA